MAQLLSEKLALEGQVATLETKLQYTQSDLKEVQVALEKEASKRVSVEREKDTLRADLAALGGYVPWRKCSSNLTLA